MNVASLQAALFDSLLPLTLATFTAATAAENAGTADTAETAGTAGTAGTPGTPGTAGTTLTAGTAGAAFLSLFTAFTQEDTAAIASDSPALYVARGKDRAASGGHQRDCQEPRPPAADPQNAGPPLPVYSFPLSMALPVDDAALQPEAEAEVEVESLAPIPAAVSPSGNSEADGSTYPAGLHDQTGLQGGNSQIRAGESRAVETTAQPLLDVNVPRHDRAVSDAGPTDREELPSADILPQDTERVKRERPATDPAAVLPAAVRQVPDAPAVTRVEPTARAASSQAPAPETRTREGVARRETLEVKAPHLAGAKTMHVASTAPLAFAARLAERGRDDVRDATRQRAFLRTPVESEPPGIAGDVIPSLRFDSPMNRQEPARIPVPEPATEWERTPQPVAALDRAGKRGSQRTSEVTSRAFVPQDNSGKAAPKEEAAALEKPALRREEPAVKSARATPTAAEAPPAIGNESRTPAQPVRNSTDAPATPRDWKTVSETDAVPRMVANEHTAAPRAPAREISMRVTAPESSDVKVDIKLVDRAGSVRVAVRTADTGVAESLQSGLTELVHRLEHKGFDAETWSPVRDSSRNVVNDTPKGGDAGQDSGRAPRDGSQREHEGGQQGGRNRPRWVAELEQSLEGRR